MTDRPDPLSPPECDLRGYEFMPLFGAKLFASEFNAIASDAEFRAAVTLWWAAWLSRPAGSLPNEDRQLAQAAGYGRDVKGWQKVRAMALHGFVECSDGRLYHSVVAHEAVKAYELRIKADKKRNDDAERLRIWREARKKQGPNGDGNAGGSQTETHDETRFTTATETEDETPDEIQSVVVRQDRDSDKTVTKEEEPSLRSGRAHATGTRLPDDWQPDAQLAQYAADQGIDPVKTAENFRDYWHSQPGARGRKTDWLATWRMWCRRDAERRSPQQNHAKPDPMTKLFEVMDHDGALSRSYAERQHETEEVTQWALPH